MLALLFWVGGRWGGFAHGGWTEPSPASLTRSLVAPGPLQSLLPQSGTGGGGWRKSLGSCEREVAGQMMRVRRTRGLSSRRIPTLAAHRSRASARGFGAICTPATHRLRLRDALPSVAPTTQIVPQFCVKIERDNQTETSIKTDWLCPWKSPHITSTLPPASSRATCSNRNEHSIIWRPQAVDAWSGSRHWTTLRSDGRMVNPFESRINTMSRAKHRWRTGATSFGIRYVSG